MDYKLIPLTGKHGVGKYAKVSPEDYDDLAQFRWHANVKSSDGRVVSAARAMTVAEGGVMTNGKHRRISMHAYLLKPPKGMHIDHINGDTLDNRRENLRLCTPQQNLRNRRNFRTSRSRYKGVSFNKDIGKWQVNFRVACESEKHAAIMYNTLAQAAYGEFARLNDIGD